MKNWWFITNTTILCQFSEKSRRPLRWATGVTSWLMNTTNSGIRLLALRANSEELTTNTGIHHIHSMLWSICSLNCQDTSEVSTTGITLVTFLPQMPTVMQMTCHSKLNQDSQLWDNGRLTGAKATVCQPDTTCSRTKINLIDTSWTIPSSLIIKTFMLRTILCRLDYQKEPLTSRFTCQLKQTQLKTVSISQL